MTIHELGTNAVKHGALSRQGGRAEIDWKPVSGGIRIRWRETGGPHVGQPSRSGLGLFVMRSGVEEQLGGALRMDWAETGLVCEIVIPAAHVVEPGAA